MDDLTLAEAIDMKSQLKEVSVEERPQPDPYHAKTGHELRPEDSRVYTNLKKTEQYAKQNKMKINQKKTKLMSFKPASCRNLSLSLMNWETLVPPQT